MKRLLGLTLVATCVFYTLAPTETCAVRDRCGELPGFGFGFAQIALVLRDLGI